MTKHSGGNYGSTMKKHTIKGRATVVNMRARVVLKSVRVLIPAIALSLVGLPSIAQNAYYDRDELMERFAKNDHGHPVDQTRFYFNDLVKLEHTSVKHQEGAGSCWSYATNSFLESEMMRRGKKPYDLSNVYSLRCALKERAESYLRMHGAMAWGEGGEIHDVLNMYALYGAMPDYVYPGTEIHVTGEKIAEMTDALHHLLDRVLEDPHSTLAHDWRAAFEAIMASFIGNAPDKFNFDGHNYTPDGFAKRAVCIHPEDYIELASFNNKPAYKKIMLEVPDNWSFNRVYNVKMDDLTDIIDHALSKGFSVVWEGDISEPYFSGYEGLAIVPEKSMDEMTERERDDIFRGPHFERYISPELRQRALNNSETTDDHAMHIVGLAEDQNHKKYYKIKNSWANCGRYGGYIYMSKTYVKYKTTTILLHKGGLTTEVRNKLNLGTSREF